jgi:hypothetical protein
MNWKTLTLALTVALAPGLIFGADCNSCGDTAKSLKLPSTSLSAQTTPGVTAKVTDTQTTIAFHATFKGLRGGLDVKNQSYLGWCPDLFGDFSKNTASTPYQLYSTYDPSLPANAQSGNWDKVNWVLNNRTSHSSWAVQQVIWRLLAGNYADDSHGFPGFPLPQPETDTLYNAALANGGGFVPQSGLHQVIGVLMYVDGIQNDPATNHVQEVLIEVPMPECGSGAIGDFVWLDTNANGIQDSGEPGINGVSVALEDAAGNTIATTVTANKPADYPFPGPNPAGYYQFGGLCGGNYQVVIDGSQTALSGLTPSPSNVGTNHSVDSNGSPAFVTLMNDTTVDETIDFGYRQGGGAACVIPSSAEIISQTSWNKFNAPAGSVVWVHAHLNPSGISTGASSTVQFTNVSFVLNGKTYPMPDGVVTFDPTASAISTSFYGGAWHTTVNPSHLSDEIFFTGAAIPIDANITGGGQATLQFTTLTDNTGLNFSWQWSAAAYTDWPDDWNIAGIQAYHNSLHAGAPTNSTVQHSLIQGPRGGGGSNYTGSWSATGHGTCK